MTPSVKEEDLQLRKYAIRWAMVFLLLICVLGFGLWWSARAIDYSTSRMQSTARPTYRVHGVVLDKATGRPVAWAEVEDDPATRPPRFRTSADHLGRFSLTTFAEPHRLVVSALGYKATSHRTGQEWYLWMPKGEERVRFELEPE